MPGKLSSHDEPFVIDNGPLGIDVGAEHVDKLSGGDKHWVREDSDLDHLLLLKKCPGSGGGDPQVEDFLVTGFDPTHGLTLNLSGSSKLKLTWVSSSPHPTLKIDDVDLERPGNGRRLKPKRGSFFIESIDLKVGGHKETIKVKSNGSSAVTVFVVLFRGHAA